jgi:hypothetical protein
MGGIIASLIGRHHAQKWWEESTLVKSAMDNIQEAFKPGSTATDDFIDMNMNILRQRPGLKKMMPQIEAGIQRMKAYRDAQAQGPQQPAQVAPEARVTSGAPLPSPGLPPPPPAEPPQLAPAFRSPVAGGSPVGGGSEGGPAPLLAPPAEGAPPLPPNQIPLPSEVAGPAQQGGGGFAGASVPAVQPMPQQVAAPSQAGGQGFGGAPTTFDQLRRVPGQLGNISPYQVGQRQAAFALPSQEVGMAVRRSLIDEAHAMGLTDPVQISDYVGGRAVQYNPAFTKVVENAMEKANIKDRIAAMQKADSAGPGQTIWDQLSARQKAEVQSGQKNISPELKPQNLPGRVTGESILSGEPNAVDFVGNKLDPKHQYLVRSMPDGTKEYVPEVAMTREILVPDEQSKTKLAKILVDRNGNEVGRVRDVAPPPGYVPRVSVQNGVMSVRQPDGRTEAIPFTSVRTTEPLTGAAPTPLIPPSTVPGGAPTTPPSRGTSRIPAAGAHPERGVTIGGYYTPEALNPAGQRIMAETVPVHEMIKRIMKEIEPHKNENTPATLLLPRIAYAMGMDYDNKGEFLGALNLSRITGAARITKGTSRAVSVLDEAKVHTARDWTDSNKLMWGKLTTIDKNLTDIESAAQRWERKSGIPGPPPEQLAAPSGGAAGAGAPAVGTIVNGFKYTGGNHRDPANWQKVK